MLHGLTGPVDGEDYNAPMVAMKSQSDQWIADITTYVKNEFGNNSGYVERSEVAKVRAQTKNKKSYWTIDSLKKEVPQELTNKDDWKVDASHEPRQAKNAIDDDPKSRYDSKKQLTKGMWFEIEFPEEVELTSVWLDTKMTPKDSVEEYYAEVSTNGRTWKKVTEITNSDYFLTRINFPAERAKFFRVTVTKNKNRYHWSIHNIRAFAK